MMYLEPAMVIKTLIVQIINHTMYLDLVQILITVALDHLIPHHQLEVHQVALAHLQGRR